MWVTAPVAPAEPPTRPASRSDRVGALVETLRNGDDPARWNACRALRDLGVDARAAVPDLLAAVEDHSRPERAVAASCLAQIAGDEPAVRDAVSRALADLDSDARSELAYGMMEVWPPATWAIPALGKLAADKEVDYPASSALGRMGQGAAPAVPALTAALKLPDCRASAALALGKIGLAAKPAVPGLIAMLDDQEANTVSAAATALGEIGPAANAAIPRLAAVMESGPIKARSTAAFALGRLGPAYAVTLPAPATQPRDGPSAIRACYAMGTSMSRDPLSHEAALAIISVSNAGAWDLARDVVDSLGSDAIPPMVAALNSQDPPIRRAACSILEHMARVPLVRHAANAAAAARALGRCLKDPEPEVRGMAGMALETFRSPAALESELQAIRAPEWDVRVDASRALGGLHADASATPAVVAALTAALADDNRYVRAVAAESLGHFGPAARGAVPLLVAALRDRDQREIAMPLPPRPLTADERQWLKFAQAFINMNRFRDHAVRALGEIGPDAAAATPALMEQLKDAPKLFDDIATLGNIGPGAAQAVPLLAELLKRDDSRFHAAEALMQIGGAGVTALVAALKDPKTRWDAEQQLGRGGPKVAPALMAALSDPDEEVGIAAAHALGANGTRARSAIPALTKATKDAAYGVRREARDALKAIDPATASKQ